MNEFEFELINEAINNRHDTYLKFIDKFFMGFSEYNSLRDLRQYEIGEEINGDAWLFAIELSDNIKDVKAIIKTIKKLGIDPNLLAEYENIETGLKTIVRGCKDKLKQKLKPVLQKMSKQQLETYNKRVISYFRYK